MEETNAKTPLPSWLVWLIDKTKKKVRLKWRRWHNILSQPLGTGQTNLWMPQGVLGQVMIGGEQGYVVRWDYSYSSWTLFTCEVEMLLHVVSTAGKQLLVHLFSLVDDQGCSYSVFCYIQQFPWNNVKYYVSILNFFLSLSIFVCTKDIHLKQVTNVYCQTKVS